MSDCWDCFENFYFMRRAVAPAKREDPQHRSPSLRLAGGPPRDDGVELQAATRARYNDSSRVEQPYHWRMRICTSLMVSA
jgi:hypothetical protein